MLDYNDDDSMLVNNLSFNMLHDLIIFESIEPIVFLLLLQFLLPLWKLVAYAGNLYECCVACTSVDDLISHALKATLKLPHTTSVPDLENYMIVACALASMLLLFIFL